jgi:hypothetical protein
MNKFDNENRELRIEELDTVSAGHGKSITSGGYNNNTARGSSGSSATQPPAVVNTQP